MDFTNEDEVANRFSMIKPDFIVHSGAMSKPDDCELQKEKALLTNVEGTKNLLYEAARYNSHFILLSTDFIFSGDRGMYREDDERSPVNFYGETKVKAEDAVMVYPFAWSIARTVLVYGKSITGRPTFIENIVAGVKRNEQLRIFEDQVRTPTYIGDLLNGILSIIQQQARGIFHLSGKDRITVFEAVIKAVRLNGLDDKLIVPIREGNLIAPARRPKLTGFDLTKANTVLGYEPVSFEEGLRRTFAASESS
jgi:dTDP-4-dehydrorhamnose reductase